MQEVIEFDEATHTYTLNGQKAISVTTLLKKTVFKDKYKGVNEDVLKAASDKGVAVHNAIEMYESLGLENNDLQEFRDYKFLKKMFGFEVKMCEIPVCMRYKDLLICGTIDQVQTKDGKLGLADIKRTSTLDKEYLSYQLNLYRLLYIYTYKEEPQFLSAIHLHDGTRKYLPIPIKEELTYQFLDDYIGGKYE